MMCSLKPFHAITRLQFKVLLVIIVIIVVPMVLTGILSAIWIANRMESSIERWIREAAQVNRHWMDGIQANASAFAALLAERNSEEIDAPAPIPEKIFSEGMMVLARQLGLELFQVYDGNGNRLYSSLPVHLAITWAKDQSVAVVRATRDDQRMLAAIRIIAYPGQTQSGYRIVMGTLFNKELLIRLEQMSGLKTRIFYPEEGGFAKAFEDHSRLLSQRLPTHAYSRLMNREDYFSAHAEGGQYWGLYTPIIDTQSGNVEAILFCGLERHGNNGFLTDKLQLFLAVALLGIFLATALGLLLSRVVVQPISYLLDAVKRVAAQDFRVAVPITSNDELGDLARSFNAMAHTLRETRDQRQLEFQRDKIAALGQLSLAMAHEIRNPIGVIKTASRLLETTQEQQPRLELQRMISEESRRLDQLLVDFQRLARHKPPDFVAIDPLEPLETVLSEQTVGRPNIQIRRTCSHGEAMVRADPDLWHQAWSNLVKNAVEALGEQGGWLEVSSRIENTMVEIRLHDSGPGISLEHMSRIFEPFFSTKEQGTGLGLTIAARLLEANGAVLALDHQSSDREGACFIVRLPILD
ncbi:MAG: HAMP domain-containing histidine kinase [Magnetococcales bacterium]|nr:HAMP domain-containing histidine kinase [Magnetococcales bacterium]